MPRRTKEQIELENKEKEPKKVKATTTKKTTKTATKKKTEPTKKENKITTKKTGTTKKKTTSKKVETKESTKTANKKTTTKKVTKKSSTTTKRKTVAKKVKIEPVEYYDLPYRYNQTVVKVLAQTPSTLFIYWDISDEDRKNYEKQYGEDFFNNTKPVLVVYNDTLGYNFEVEINDFANS